MGLASIQAYCSERKLELPASAKDLCRALRSSLLRASNSRGIQETPADIYKRLKLLPEPPPQILEQLRARSLHERAFCILGGEKNQDRDHERPHFKRSDGAWFDFSIVVRERNKELELLAYDFEIRLPAGRGAPFLRFDLNLPEHANDERDLRCHLHPGSDDILVPAPMMTPSELLALFLEGLQFPEARRQRSVTAFELRWYGETHALCKS